MGVFNTTGTTISLVAGEPASEDAAGFAALTYVEIGGVTNVPDFGAVTAKVTFTPLKTGVVEKLKGETDYGSVDVDAGYLEGDAGQLLVEEAVNGVTKNDKRSFKLEYPNGAIRYWVGNVFSYTEGAGAGAVVMSKMNIEISSVVVKVAAP